MISGIIHSDMILKSVVRTVSPYPRAMAAPRFFACCRTQKHLNATLTARHPAFEICSRNIMSTARRSVTTRDDRNTALEPSFTSDFEYGSDGDHFSTKAKRPPRWYQRPVVWILALMPVLTFGLGAWQIKRLRWKLDLIDELESKLRREPLTLPKNVE